MDDNGIAQSSTTSSFACTNLTTQVSNLSLLDHPSRHSKLPAEIFDYIIDKLQDDRPSLESCSLTCRSWLPRARHHLFRTINLDVLGAVRFHKLFAENAQFACYVRRLCICASRSYIDDLPLVSLPNIVQSLIGQMPNVTALQLEHWSMNEPVNLHGLGEIRHLQLHSCSISSRFALRTWLEAMPGLERVELHDLDVEMIQFEDRLLRLGAPVLPQVVELKFVNSASVVQGFMDTLLAGRTKPHIKVLFLDRVPPDCASSWPSWFNHIAPLLEHIQFRVHTVQSVPLLNVGLCAKLRVLDLSVRWPNVEQSFVVETWVLTQLSSPHLKVIQFKHVAWWSTFLPSNSPNWSGFVNLLSSPKFASLERLAFHFPLGPPRLGRLRRPSPAEIFDEIKQSLPGFNVRGVLEFSH